MIRAKLGDKSYWDTWVDFDQNRSAREWQRLAQPSANERYRPQFAFDTALGHTKQIIRRYSRGDLARELAQHFQGLLDAWDLSNRLATDICQEHKLPTCRDWTFKLSDLNHYNWCFWLVGLALALDLPEDQWQRLLALIGGAGEDELLDRIIASREPSRKIGTALLHPKPYARLLAAIDASSDEQPALLKAFVDHWYAELARKGKQELWWYVYGDPVKHPLEKGSYFGRWCIEAVAAVKAFDMDDSLCLGHEHYPGDLLRPDGPSTHAPRTPPKTGLLQRLFGRNPG